MSELIIGIIARAKRKLKEAGATSDKTAKTPEELGLPKKWLQMPRVVETVDGRYYIKCEDGKHC